MRPIITTAVTALLATACADAQLDGHPEGIRERGDAHASELMYLRTADEVLAATGGDTALAPAQAFHGVDLMWTLRDAQSLAFEYQVRRADGTWSGWQTGALDEGFGRFRAARLTLDGPATALRLRGSVDAEFARLEFFAQRAPEGAAGFDDDFHGGEGPGDETSFDFEEKAARSGQWALPASVLAAGARQHVSYTGAPAWNGGRNCSGGFTAGAGALGDYLVANFAGARYFQGYNCRQIGGSSSMSVHGTGRAIDVFVPLDGGAADNDLGDPVANWLVEHAEEIGVQLIIWDRTIWNPSRSDQARYYSGDHPHHDHLHIELTPAASRRETPFFGGGVQPPPPSGGGSSAHASCQSQTLGRAVEHGQCVQMSYEHCGGTCQWAICGDGAWLCADRGDCAVEFGNPACGAAPAPTPCPCAAPAA